MKRLFRLLGPLVVTLVFLAAVWLLYRELRAYRLADIAGRLAEIPAWAVLAAAGFTVLNYLILVGYDWLAIRYIGQPLPLRRIALASFAGYACSYNFGATLAGTTIRLRLYSAWGVPALKIVQLLVILGLTFWFGLFALAGGIFLFDPPEIGARARNAEAPAAAAVEADGTPADKQRQMKLDETLDHIAHLATNMRLWGAGLLAVAVGYLTLSIFKRGSVRFLGKQLPVPPPGLTIYQYLITAADMLVAGVVLHLLLAHVPGVPPYFELLGIYLVVYVAVVLSHVPGGYGVFEGGMLFCMRQAATTAVPADSLMAALLVFRIVYFWLPLLLAIVLLSMNEVALGRGRGELRPPAES